MRVAECPVGGGSARWQQGRFVRCRDVRETVGCPRTGTGAHVESLVASGWMVRLRCHWAKSHPVTRAHGVLADLPVSGTMPLVPEGSPSNQRVEFVLVDDPSPCQGAASAGDSAASAGSPARAESHGDAEVCVSVSRNESRDGSRSAAQRSTAADDGTDAERPADGAGDRPGKRLLPRCWCGVCTYSTPTSQKTVRSRLRTTSAARPLCRCRTARLCCGASARSCRRRRTSLAARTGRSCSTGWTRWSHSAATSPLPVPALPCPPSRIRCA